MAPSPSEALTVPRKALTLTEAHFSRQVREYAQMNGWEVFSLEAPGAAFRKRTMADLYLVHSRMKRAVWLELKRDGAKPTQLQHEFLALMSDCGVEAAWVTPSDWPVVERLLRRDHATGIP